MYLNKARGTKRGVGKGKEDVNLGVFSIWIGFKVLRLCEIKREQERFPSALQCTPTLKYLKDKKES